MKKYNVLILLLVAVMFIYACDEETADVITNPQDQIPAMSATINGTDWSADAFAGVDSAQTVIIAGTNTGENSSILFGFTNDFVEGSYDLSDSTSGVSATYTFSTSVGIASSGNITISNYNTSLNIVSGTFSFETDSTFLTPTPYSVTNGEFTNVKIISQ